jgi:serine/threonine-protein kinase
MLIRPPTAGPSPSTPKTLLVSIGANASLFIGWGPATIISRDGTTIAFVAEQAGIRRLFVRGLDQLRATPLPGTEGANHPFFSPDGRWIAFFADEKLKKVPTSGGPVMTLCDARRGRGGDWGDDGVIVFAPDISVPLHRVSAAGGAPEVVGADGVERATRRWPQVLPDGKGVLYTSNSKQTLAGFETAEVRVASPGSATPKVLVRQAYYGRYVTSGHLIYVQFGRVLAVRFDLEKLKTMGDAVSILDSAEVNQGSGGAQLSFSSDGTLVYVPRRPQASPLDWVTREGVASKLVALESDWANPKFSPDGTKLAFDASDGRQRDIFVYDMKRGARKQMTFEGSNDFLPVWSPDGRFLAFSSDRSGGDVANIYWMKADGTNEATRLTRSTEDENVGSWHPSGRWLAYSSSNAERRLDIKILPVEDDRLGGLTAGEPLDFLSTQATEGRPMFSPDGRWIAYSSDETGEVEVFVRPFPSSGGKWRVSRHGGWYPRWASKPPRLMFTELDNRQVFFAEYDGRGESFEASEPALWSKPAHKALGGFLPYDVHPEGSRIVMRVDTVEPIDHVVLFSGFLEFLRKAVPGNEGSAP